jgi:hypothetical protein
LFELAGEPGFACAAAANDGNEFWFGSFQKALRFVQAL